MKKVICILLTVVMVCSLFCTAAAAEGTKTKGVYSYVALGDSVAAGFGLNNESGSFGDDPALIITEELLANPIAEAYPQVFGSYIAEWGAERGYDVNATNLSACAYTAEDAARTISEEGYYSPLAESIFTMMGGLEGENPLLAYHDLFVNYLTQADLVSIQLGGNDLLLGVVLPMVDGSNPILTAAGYATLMVFVGMDAQTALGVALMVLDYYKDSITAQTVTEAINYIAHFYQKAEACIDSGAANVGKVIDAIRALNSDADIAVLSQFNPFGNSLELDGKKQDVATVLTEIIVDSMAYMNSGETFNADVLRAIVMKQISYPLQYLFAAKSMENLFKGYNAKLEAVAEEKGVTYIDVYGISNENNLDPHPDAQRHKEIADLMAESLQQMVIDKMVEPAFIPGDADGDGEVTILDATAVQRFLADLNVESFYEKAADYDRDGEVTILDATAIQRLLAELPSGEAAA